MNSCTKVFDALKSRYRNLSRPPSDAGRQAGNHGEYSSLWVFGTRELDDDHDRQHSPSPDSFDDLPLTEFSAKRFFFLATLAQLASITDPVASFSKPMVDLNIIYQPTIKEKIISALSALRFQRQHVLVQFWSPDTVRKLGSLTTLDQPFALGVVDDKGLYSYRLDSEQRMFILDEKQREELGPPARVYRQKSSEWSFDSQTLSTKQSVEDVAAYYNIYGYLLLPVFESNSGCCVGVLELVTSSSNYADYASEVQEVSRALKEANLKSPNVFEDPTINVSDYQRRQHELDEISFALKTVCVTHKLPLAQTWSLTGNSSFVANSRILEQSCSSFKKSCIGKICMSTGDHLPFYISDTSMLGFHKACTEQHQGKSRGVVGRSLSSCGSCFCQDVTQLSEDDYPLVPFARVSGLTSCLAIYIKSINTAAEYVIEFFLPTSISNEAEKTLQQHIQETCARLLICNIECRPSPITLLTPSDVPRMSENEPSDFGAMGRIHGLVPYSEKGMPHRKRKRSDSSISLDEIKKHFGKPISQAAVDLRVSRSTLKRICRDLGLQTWPCRNRDSLPSPITFLTEEGTRPPESGNQQPLVENERNNRINEAEVLYFPVGIQDIGVNRGKTGRNFNDKSKMKKASVGLEIISDGEKELQDMVKDMIHATKSEIDRIRESLGIPRLREEYAQPEDYALPGIYITEEYAQHEEYAEPEDYAPPEEYAESEITVKASYMENMVRFPFRLSEGLVELQELVAMRFKLRHGSFKLKYKDEAGDILWISCDDALMESASEFRRPDGRIVMCLLVKLNA